jgi:predicted TIM-barrel fold metal-dependent hydrolase
VISNVGDWGPDMLFRPLIESYPNVHFEISEYTLDGGIESFVQKYTAERMLFGTGFPAFEHGGPMLALRHSEISDEDKELIAHGNLENLLDWE